MERDFRNKYDCWCLLLADSVRCLLKAKMPPLQQNCSGSVVTNEGKVLNEADVKERVEELRKLMIGNYQIRVCGLKKK